MDRLAFIQLWVDTCTECGIKITLEGELPAGRRLVCPSCGTNLGFAEPASAKQVWAFACAPKENKDLEIGDYDRDWDLQPLPAPN